ncbi:magnesium transporter CorA family protein [Sinimarinibacterium thermocellulolyticum]|uniref:CorA family divalent cation transporter n=1 Tax=Sinimarinibacterium thermocellulolyticum TaxID=3170016 RepID=A0ABV2A8S8_9GAMM
MIRNITLAGDQVLIANGLPPADRPAPAFVWLEVSRATDVELAEIRGRYGISPRSDAPGVLEEGDHLYIRTLLVSPQNGEDPRFQSVTFVIGETLVASFSAEPYAPFDLALQRMQRRPRLVEGARDVLRRLLQSANDASTLAVERLADALARLSARITQLSAGYNDAGQELGVSDLTDTMLELNERENLLTDFIEAQLTLHRAVRHLSGEIDHKTEPDLQQLVYELLEDVRGTKEHAAFEHDKVRYLQNAVTNILNIKQNQIVKVFTIITAVFLPPTLVGTFYGMNFSVMPELSWEHGFTYSMLLTLVAAVLPLVYIKRKGWLR